MSQRSDQVAEELRKIISVIFLEDLSHLPLGFVTVTRIELTADLRFARVFYSVLGSSEQKQQTQDLIAVHLTHIRRLVVERINMRYAMDIRFLLDESIEHSLRIEEILNKIKKENKSGG